MADSRPFYITTTLPYVNADPHIGFAMELVRADVIARYHRAVLGEDVFFNTGTDEHGAKIYEAATKEGADPQQYVDRFAARFRELLAALNIGGVTFIRTTDPHHVSAAQEFWRRCDVAGDIYKKEYQIKYCVGCELEKTDSELVDGKCPIHPNREIEIREEENYFFRWSKYQKPLLEYYRAHPDFVIPEFRFNETKAFVERGLEDFSISRLRSKMPWGIPVPGDDDHVMYVWFDALTNYISTLGWPEDTSKFKRFWENGTPVQYCGKDNNRQQSAMWQGMLLSAGLPLTRHIVIDGFITSGGQKMSKSLGNVISPFDIIEEYRSVARYPEDVLRFTLLREIPSFEDGDLTRESIRESYAANLQNGIGNLTSRVMRMATMHLPAPVTCAHIANLGEVYAALEKFDTKKAMDEVLRLAQDMDRKIQLTEPFKVVKIDPKKGRALIEELVRDLHTFATALEIFLPRTARKILSLIAEHNMPEAPLFNRLP
jgi:methionyl-tRNA synthetase